jgi:hypothetical protein
VKGKHTGTPEIVHAVGREAIHRQKITEGVDHGPRRGSFFGALAPNGRPVIRNASQDTDTPGLTKLQLLGDRELGEAQRVLHFFR